MSEVINDVFDLASGEVCCCGHHRSIHPDDGPCHEHVPALTWEADYTYYWCDGFEPMVRQLEDRG